MTILRAEAIPVSLPFEMGGPKPMFAGLPRQMDMLLIRIETADGLVGWGEAFGFAIWPATKSVFDKLIVPQIIGIDEADIAGIGARFQRQFHILGRGGAATYALSGLDIALWDLRAKRAGKPLCALLGGARHASLPGYASLIRYADAALVARNTSAAIGRGYRAIKLHELGAAEVRAARAAMGSTAGSTAGSNAGPTAGSTAGPDAALMMDVNCPWTVDQALAVAAEVRDSNLLWFEEPVWPPEDFAGLAEVRKRGGIPTAAGENCISAHHFEIMMRAGAVDYAQPSVTKIGGVTEFVKVMEMAARHQVRLMPHSPYLGPGLLATVHLLATLEVETMVEYSFVELGANPLGEAIAMVNGRIAVPQAPGLGRDPDLGIVEQYRVRA